MTAFVDSSAVVKLYVPERYHEVVRARTDTLVVSAVTRVEVASALWRKHRLGELAAADAATLTAVFEADLDEPAGRFATVPASTELLGAAVRLTAQHGLRAYDAVQLATATAARSVLGQLDVFVAFDVQLRMAATVERFEVLPETLER